MNIVKNKFFSDKEKQNVSIEDRTPGKPLKSSSLLDLTKTLHDKSLKKMSSNLEETSDINNSRPAAIWVSMASFHEHFKKKPRTKKDSALDDLGNELSKDFNFKLLNKKEIEIDTNFVTTLTNAVNQYLETIEKPNTGANRPSISIILSAHGAPSWFFGPINDYYYAKHGCIWPNFKFDGKSNDSKTFLKQLLYSHFIWTETRLYYYNKTQNSLLSQSLSSIQHHDFFRDFNQINLKNKQTVPHIPSLNRHELCNLFSMLPKLDAAHKDRSNSFNLKSFIQDECEVAKTIADAFKQVESQTNIEFTSIILFSCNSATEFINEETFEASLSSARVLSTLFPNRFVIGGIGLNANGKTGGLYHQDGTQPPMPNLIKTLTVYCDGRVIYRPIDKFYLDYSFFNNLDFMQYFKQENPFLESHYVVEDMERHYHLANALHHQSEFAGFQLKILNKMVKPQGNCVLQDEESCNGLEC